MNNGKIDNNDFLDQLRSEVSVYQSFSGIFEKCLQEDYVGAVLLVFSDIFQKELHFVVSSLVISVGLVEAAPRNRQADGADQSPGLQGELQDRGVVPR